MTRLGCDEILKHLTANLLQSTPAKKFQKRSIFYADMTKMQGLTFLLGQ